MFSTTNGWFKVGKRWPRLALLLGAGLGLGAQPFQGGREHGWQYGWPLGLAGRTLYEEGLDPLGQPFSRSRELRWDQGRLALGWGNVWGLRPAAGGHPVYRSDHGVNWEWVGLFDGPLPQRFMPLGEDHLLALAPSPLAAPYELDGEASPFGVFRRGENGTYRLRRELPLVEGGFFETQRPASKAPGSEAPPSGGPEPKWKRRPGLAAFFFQMVGGASWVALPRGGVLVSLRTGHLWVLGPEGELRHHKAVFSEYLESDFRRMVALPAVLLGLAPTQEGHLLMVSRSKAGVFEAAERFPGFHWDAAAQRVTPGDPVAASDRTRLQRFAYPELLWWDFDPETGRLDLLDVPPPGAPDRLPPEEDRASLLEAQGLAFHVSRQGGVVLEAGGERP